MFYCSVMVLLMCKEFVYSFLMSLLFTKASTYSRYMFSVIDVDFSLIVSRRKATLKEIVS